MGTASKVFNVIFRLGELCSSVIVLGIVGHFLYIVGDSGTYADSRLVYAVVVASISTALSLIALLPFTFSFLIFPIDLILFVNWLVVYCLLQTLTGLNPCSSVWYYNYWGYYWGGYWTSPRFIVTGPGDIDWVGCGPWLTVLAFSFIASMIYLASAALGCTVTVKLHEEKRELRLRHEALEKTHGQPMFPGAPTPAPTPAPAPGIAPAPGPAPYPV